MARPRGVRRLASVLLLLSMGALMPTIAAGAKLGGAQQQGRLVFTRVVDDGGTATTAVFSAAADGSDVRQLTHPGGGGDSDPRVSANGRKIVFVRQPAGLLSTQLWVVDADGTHAQKVSTHLPAGAQPTDPTFEGNDTIVYASLESGLYALRLGGNGHPKRLTQGHDSAAAVSASGSTLVFARGDAILESEPVGATPRVIYRTKALPLAIALAPDLRHLAFTEAGGDYLLTIRTHRAIAISCATPPQTCGPTAFSPDGATLALTIRPYIPIDPGGGIPHGSAPTNSIGLITGIGTPHAHEHVSVVPNATLGDWSR